MTTISSRALARSCDFYPKHDGAALFKNDCTGFIPDHYNGLSNGSIVYVPTSCLKAWYEHIGVKIKELGIKIVLVTGGSVYGAPREISILSQTNMYAKMAPMLSAWFTQNLDVSGVPGMFPIPVGVDFHHLLTDVDTRKFFKWLGPKQTVSEQDEELIEIRDEAPDWDEREDKGYCFFQFQLFERHNRDRHVALEELPAENDDLVYAPERSKRTETWKEMTKYKYIISPHGNGLDCYRTWEAIELGCIAVVKRSTLSDSGLYNDLPVIILDSWKEFLDHEIREQKTNLIKPYLEKCNNKTLEYWVGRFEQALYS